MSKKSILVELYNKYPQHRVEHSGESISVRDGQSGKLIVHLKMTCHGAFECDKHESGAKECHDRSPIAESAKVFELKADGSIGKVEAWEDARLIAFDHVKKYGKVLCEKEEQDIMRKEAALMAKEKAKKRAEELKSEQEVA